MMDMGKRKWKKISAIKNLLRSLSFQRVGSKSSSVAAISWSRSKSWHYEKFHDDENDNEYIKTTRLPKVAPQGCFSVYVGPEKQRFVIKANYANHPLFNKLLEDAELEYGHTSQGPLLLPCDVDLFYKILAEMESSNGNEIHSGGDDGFAYCSCTPFHTANRTPSDKD